MKNERCCSYPKVVTVILGVVFIKLLVVYYISNNSWTQVTIEPKHRAFYEKVVEHVQSFNNRTFTDHMKDLKNMIPELVGDKSVADTAMKHLADLENALNSIHKKPWHELADKFERLNENIIYKSLNIKKPEKRENVNVIFIVSSAPARHDRRLAIRETWWPHCRSTERLSIKCVFLTDQKDKTTQEGKDLLEEADKFQDLYFQNLAGGHDFGKRFLYHLVWAKQNYNFDYFLRLDDDYFICMDRFVREVPMPPREKYHWGWLHCVNQIVRPEESIVLLSKDIVESFLGQDEDKMLCHRWADQMIGVWKEELQLPTYYHHDDRLHHDPPAQFLEEFKTKQNICTKYIGVHGAYPVQMRTLWKNRGDNNYPEGKSFDDYSHTCALQNTMRWDAFGPDWKAEPKLCKTNPFWGGSSGTTYIGRQGSS